MRVVTTLALLFAVPALADAVDVQLSPKALKGKGLPQVIVRITEPVAGVRLVLKRGDGKTLEQRWGGKVGFTRTIDLDQPEGTAHWEGELTVNLPDATSASMPLAFDTELWGPLVMKLDKDKDVDVPGRKVTFTLSRPAAKAWVRVLMDTGALAFEGEVPFSGEPAGTPLTITWPEAPGQVMRVEVKGYDAGGFFTGVELSPWRVDIPHEEVNFDSGKAVVRPSEEAKLDASFALIADAVRKFGRLAELKLFVAGHTDTVGQSDKNLKLSRDRARAIAAAFRKRGLRISIAVEGFGEEALLVQTPDETDEPKNRRAEYIISIEEPAAKGTSFKPKWERL